MKVFGKNPIASTSVFQKHSVSAIGDHPHSARIFGKLSTQSFKQRAATEIPDSGSMGRSSDDFRINKSFIDTKSNRNTNFEPRNELTKRSSNGLERSNGFTKKMRL